MPFLCNLIKGKNDITTGKNRMRAGELDCITLPSDQSHRHMAQAQGEFSALQKSSKKALLGQF